MVSQSPQRLVLLHRPVMLCAALGLGVLLLVFATFWNISQGDWVKAGTAFVCTLALMAPALWFAAERVDVAFDAPSAQVTIHTRRLSGSQQETYPLPQVQKAMVQTHKGPSDTAGSHRVALVLEPGGVDNRLPLTTGYAGGRGAGELVARINTWLEAQRNGS